jgi:catechol 1,2-dioxygenase
MTEHDQLPSSQTAASNERVTKVAMDLIETVKDRLAANDVTHQEYRAAWAWLAKLASSGELPLFLDVHFEADVERITFEGKPGSEGTIQGPYHLDDHPVLERPYRMPMRDDEPGQPFVFTGRVLDLDGRPVAGVTIDAWQAGNDGTYSGFVGDAPRGNLRGIMTTGDDGGFRFGSIRPAPYRIPYGGPTGEFLAMTGRHAWRPAHFHFILSKDGYDPLITQIYFDGDRIIEGQGDIVGGVKDSLVITVGEGSDPEMAAAHGVTVPYQTGDYTFTLRPSTRRQSR